MSSASLQQHLLARLRRLLRPAAAAERGARARDGAIDVELLAGGHRAQRTAGGRIDVVERGAARRRHEAPVDEHLRTRLERGGAFAPLGGGN